MNKTSLNSVVLLDCLLISLRLLFHFLCTNGKSSKNILAESNTNSNDSLITEHKHDLIGKSVSNNNLDDFSETGETPRNKAKINHEENNDSLSDILTTPLKMQQCYDWDENIPGLLSNFFFNNITINLRKLRLLIKFFRQSKCLVILKIYIQ